MNPHLKKIKERLDAATKGPWYVTATGQAVITAGDSPIDNRRVCESNSMEHYYHGKQACYNNIQFIAHSRTDIATLLEAVRIYEEALRFYTKHLDDKTGATLWGFDAGKKALEAITQANKILEGE
jgi:hypothetical protein